MVITYFYPLIILAIITQKRRVFVYIVKNSTFF